MALETSMHEIMMTVRRKQLVFHVAGGIRRGKKDTLPTSKASWMEFGIFC
jgi:hypothetical protein